MGELNGAKRLNGLNVLNAIHRRNTPWLVCREFSLAHEIILARFCHGASR
jgi:hypothetical protein